MPFRQRWIFKLRAKAKRSKKTIRILRKKIANNKQFYQQMTQMNRVVAEENETRRVEAEEQITELEKKLAHVTASSHQHEMNSLDQFARFVATDNELQKTKRELASLNEEYKATDDALKHANARISTVVDMLGGMAQGQGDPRLEQIIQILNDHPGNPV